MPSALQKSQIFNLSEDDRFKGILGYIFVVNVYAIGWNVGCHNKKKEKQNFSFFFKNNFLLFVFE